MKLPKPRKRLDLTIFTPLAVKLLELSIDYRNKGCYTYVGVKQIEDALKKIKENHNV